MDDHFLKPMRRDPDPDFARRLRERLAAQGEARAEWRVRPVPVFAVAAAIVVVVSLFAFPAVRVSAQAMLDLFRVRRFSAVAFDEKRVEKLRSMKPAEGAMLVFDKTETVRDPGPGQAFTDPIAAAAAAGLDARRPGYLPDGLQLDSVFVHGAGEARLTVSEAKLRSVLDALDLRDVTVPAGLDGQVVDVKKPPTMVQRYKNGRWKAALIQSNSPELSVPAGLDIERLAEIGLRVIGLDAAEAKRVAQSTDWRTTLVVPVPLNASTFRQVTVHGLPGLLITTSARAAVDDSGQRDGSVVMWAEGDRVYAIAGNLGPADTLEMAESVR
jgi:hypothetical protein